MAAAAAAPLRNVAYSVRQSRPIPRAFSACRKSVSRHPFPAILPRNPRAPADDTSGTPPAAYCHRRRSTTSPGGGVISARFPSASTLPGNARGPRLRWQQAASAILFRPHHPGAESAALAAVSVGLVSTDRYGRFSIPVLRALADALKMRAYRVSSSMGRRFPAGRASMSRQLLQSACSSSWSQPVPRGVRAAAQLRPHFRPGSTRLAQVQQANRLCLLPTNLGEGARPGTLLRTAEGGSRI